MDSNLPCIPRNVEERWGTALREAASQSLLKLIETISRSESDFLPYLRFDGRHYVRVPLLITDELELTLIGWEPGQCTPIHDHQGACGAMRILSGTIKEEKFAALEGCPSLEDARKLADGDLSETGVATIHRLIAASHGRVVSLHLYRPPLRTMGIYGPAGLVNIQPVQDGIPE